MQQHVLARRHQHIPRPHLIENMQFPTCSRQPQCRHSDPGSGGHFGQMADMRFGGEIAAAGCDIVGIAADQRYETVRRLAKGLSIAAVVHVNIVIGPVQRHRPVNRQDRLGQINRVQLRQ